MSTETAQETYSLAEILASVKESNRLILWNDDINTFDHVIFCMMHHLQYAEAEAERIAFKVHHQGKCPVLEGSMTEMEIYRKILKAEGLTVSVE